MPLTVERVNGDWVTRCPTHDEEVTCGLWSDAMEAAWGHIAMRHGNRDEEDK